MEETQRYAGEERRQSQQQYEGEDRRKNPPAVEEPPRNPQEGDPTRHTQPDKA